MPYINIVETDPPHCSYGTVGASYQPNVKWHVYEKPPDYWLSAKFEAWNTATGEKILDCPSLEGIQRIPEVCEGYYTWSRDSFIMPNAEVRLRCTIFGDKGTTFDTKEWLFHPIAPYVTLTIKVVPPEGGTTWPRPGTHKYVRYERVTVSAFPAEGYVFDRWELDGRTISRDVVVIIEMDSDHTLTAYFTPTTAPPPTPPAPMKPKWLKVILPIIAGSAALIITQK